MQVLKHKLTATTHMPVVGCQTFQVLKPSLEHSFKMSVKAIFYEAKLVLHSKKDTLMIMNKGTWKNPFIKKKARCPQISDARVNMWVSVHMIHIIHDALSGNLGDSPELCCLPLYFDRNRRTFFYPFSIFPGCVWIPCPFPSNTHIGYVYANPQTLQPFHWPFSCRGQEGSLRGVWGVSILNRFCSSLFCYQKLWPVMIFTGQIIDERSEELEGD